MALLVDGLVMFERLTEYPMDRFIHRQNLEHFRKQLAETTDETQRGYNDTPWETRKWM